MKVWLNEALMEAAEARIDPADRGMLLGDGLFETLCAVDGRVVAAAPHFERLRQGADYLGIPVQRSDEELHDLCATLLHANALTAGRAGLRLTLTRGTGPRGLLPPSDPQPTLLLTSFAVPLPPMTLSLATASVRCNEYAPCRRFKTLSYLDNVLARRQAAARGADEAVMLNTAGRVASASAANIWVVEGETLVTPPLDDGPLPGITRARLFEVASALGLSAREDSIAPERLAAADEVFLTNSLIGVVAAGRLDGRVLPPARLAPRLQAAYWAAPD